MRGVVAWIAARLRARADSEHGQAAVRLCIALLILVYLWSLQSIAPDIGTMVLVMLCESVIGLGLMAWIVIVPARSDVRRWIGMFADYSTLGLLMAINPEALAPLYVLILWVTIGNGLRYGPRYLYSAAALGLLAFSAVILGSSYWMRQPYLAGGLWVGLLALPLYLSSLLRDLKQATNEARRANAAKTRFLATMSHELRSPLNGIIGMSELLRSTRMTDEQRESVGVIHTSAQALRLLVDEILDISAIEAGKLQRHDADFLLADSLRRLETMLRPLAMEKNLTLEMRVEPGIPPRLHGDSAHLTQILMNLLGNAIKFTDTGGVTLVVQLRQLEAGRAALRFSVRDTGIGISDDNKARIFEAFEQVDIGPTRRYGGSGLGTTIARTLAGLLEGKLGLEDNPGGGSHFWLDVEMQAAAELACDERLAGGTKIVSIDDPFIRHRARVKGMRILVADDQQTNRTVLTRILERAGHKVVVAVDGEDALDRIEVFDIELAIVDMHMPHLSGIDVIRQLRVMQAGAAPRTPVIMLSADATGEAAAEAMAAGAHCFLSKPVVLAKLLEAIAGVAGPPAQEAEPPPAAAAQEAAGHASVLEDLAMMGLDAAALSDFVEQCLHDAATCVAGLGKAGRDRNWHAYRDAAHALKGIAENLGAKAVAERCRVAMRAEDAILGREHGHWHAELEGQLGEAAGQSRRELERIIGNRVREGGMRPAPDAS